MWFLSIIPNLLGLAADYVKGKRELEQAKVEGKIAVTKAVTDVNLKMAMQGQAHEIKWAEAQVLASATSWKDEYFTIVLSVPAIMSFIPGMSSYVEAGFSALNTTPQWYQTALLVAIGASFGVRLWKAHKAPAT